MHADRQPSPAANSMGMQSADVAAVSTAAGTSDNHHFADEMGRPAPTRRVKRGIADTSREAFHSLSPAHYLSPKERAVLALFTGPEVKLSRQQIAELAGMPLCGCCGRVDSLLTKGLLVEEGDRIDPHTGKRQKTLQLPRAAQGELVERGGA